MLESSADGSQQRRRCVACGFSESMDAPNASAMPRARFERSRAAPGEHQPVKILDPSWTQRAGKHDDCAPPDFANRLKIGKLFSRRSLLVKRMFVLLNIFSSLYFAR